MSIHVISKRLLITEVWLNSCELAFTKLNIKYCDAAYDYSKELSLYCSQTLTIHNVHLHLPSLCIIRVSTIARPMVRLWEMPEVHYHLELSVPFQAVLQSDCVQK